MLRLLGAWNIPASARALLLCATVFLVVGFLTNLVASLVKSEPLLIVSAAVVVAGAACGISATVKTGRDRGS